MKFLILCIFFTFSILNADKKEFITVNNYQKIIEDNLYKVNKKQQFLIKENTALKKEIKEIKERLIFIEESKSIEKSSTVRTYSVTENLHVREKSNINSKVIYILKKGRIIKSSFIENNMAYIPSLKGYASAYYLKRLN